MSIIPDTGLPDLGKFTVKSHGDTSVPQVLDDEFAKLGYNDNARLSILGDVGRENNWNRNTIFKGHSDPANGAYNRGIISWQGDRQTALNNYLKKTDVYGKNNDDELRGMAQFMDSELRTKFPAVHNKLINAQSTADASNALRQYIKYNPSPPYNSPDPNFGVKNNADWANKAKRAGLGQLPDLSHLAGELPDLSSFASQDLPDLTHLAINDSKGGQPVTPTVTSPQTVQAPQPQVAEQPVTVPDETQTVQQPQQPVLVNVDPTKLFGGNARVAPSVQTPVQNAPVGQNVPPQSVLVASNQSADEQAAAEDAAKQNAQFATEDARPQKAVTPQNQDNAVIKTFDVKPGASTREILNQIAPEYGINVNKVLADNPNLQIVGNNGKVDVTKGDLDKFGVDTAPLIRQKVAENRVENPTPDLRVDKNWATEDAQNLTDVSRQLNAPLEDATSAALGLDPKILSNVFGDAGASAISAALNAGGNTAKSVAGLLRIIGDLNPAKGDSMAEAAGVKPYRAGEDIVNYLKEVSDTTSRFAANSGNKYQDTATADDKGYLEGRPIERNTIGTKIGSAVGGLADLPRIALMPGGLAAPVLSFATDAMMLTAAEGDKADYGNVAKAGAKNAAIGALTMLAPGVGKAADTVAGTLLNRASSNIIKEGVTLGTIGGGTYATARAFGDTPEQAFDQAVMMAAFHAVGKAKELGKDLTNVPIRVKDGTNEAVIEIGKDNTVKTLDPKTEAQAQIEIPKDVVSQKAVERKFTPEPKGEPTSIKHAEINADRENRGWKTLSKRIEQSNPDLHKEVQDIIAKDPDAPLKTFEKYKEHPKAVPNAAEKVLLNKHLIDMKAEATDVAKRYTAAIDSGDPLELTNAEMDRKVANRKLDEAQQVAWRGGSETGASLQVQKMFADEDFEFTTLERNFKVAKGRDPSSEELQKLQQIADDHKAKSDALEAVLAGKEQEIADIKAQIPPKHILDIAENYVNKLHTLAEKERERLKTRGNVFQSGIDPRDLKSAAIIGADHLANMSLDFAKWSDKMVDEFGDKIKPHLDKIFEEAQKVLKGGHAELKSDADIISRTLKAQKTRMENRIKELENAIQKRERITRTRTSLKPDAELEQLQEKAKSLKEDYDAIFPREPRAPMTDAQRLTALEKRLGKKQKAITEKIANKDLSETVRRDPLDPMAVRGDTSGKYTAEDKATAQRIIAARAEVGKVEKRFNRMKQEAERAGELKRKWIQRKLKNYVRGSMLSAVTVIEKLGAASIGRTVTRPVKTAIGYVASQLPGLRGIARKAAIEGSKGLMNDVGNEVHAIAKAYTTGIMDIGRTITGRGTDISNAFGKSENYLSSGRYLPVEASQLIGLMHDSLKAPAFRSEYEGVLGNLILDAKQHDQPIDNETMFVLGQKAYDYAQRAKFNESRTLTDLVQKHVLGPLDNNELTPVQAIGTFLHIVMPIHKISTNVIAQSFESSPLGLAKGIARAASADVKGLDKLTPDQADIIMRNIKNGSFGSAMYALGLFGGGSVIGSFYQEYDKDTDKEKPKYNTVQIDGVRIPAAMLHLPEFNAMFMGATTKRIYEEMRNKGATKTEAGFRGVGAAVGGLVDETPGVEAADALGNIYHALRGGDKDQMSESRYGIGNFVAGRTVPGLMRNTAEWFDQDPQGHFNTPFTREPYHRKVDPKTFGSSVKTQFQKGIPFWRNRLPNNTPTKK